MPDSAMRAATPAARLAPGSPALFVFDDEWIAAERHSAARLRFLYACAVDAGASVRRGDVVRAVLDFAALHDARRVVTTRAADPRIKRQIERLAASLRVDAVPDDPLIDPAVPTPDLRRFSRYWSKAQRSALRPSASERSGLLFPDP